MLLVPRYLAPVKFFAPPLSGVDYRSANNCTISQVAVSVPMDLSRYATLLDSFREKALRKIRLGLEVEDLRQITEAGFFRTTVLSTVPHITLNVVLYGLADVYDVGFLRRDCEKHLLATEGIKAIDKLLLAQSLNKTDFIAHFVGSLGRADLKHIEKVKRKDQLSTEVKDQLREREKLFA